jgi:hypothetical protein
MRKMKERKEKFLRLAKVGRNFPFFPTERKEKLRTIFPIVV